MVLVFVMNGENPDLSVVKIQKHHENQRIRIHLLGLWIKTYVEQRNRLICQKRD